MTTPRQPDLLMPRKQRIFKLERLVERAKIEGNTGNERYFRKELEIQRSYLEIESK